MNDQAIIAELERLREPARRCFEHYADRERLGVSQQTPSPDISELIKVVAASLRHHPEFANPCPRFFGAKQLALGSPFQAVNLLHIALNEGPITAVAWLRKIFSTNLADLRYVATVYGLRVSCRMVLRNGVTFVPLEGLPSSANANAVQRQVHSWAGPNPISMMFPIGVTLEVPNVRAASDYQSAIRDQGVAPRSDVLERTVSSLTLLDGAAPVIGTSWLEFTDADLMKAEVGQMWTAPTYEGSLNPVIDVDISDDTIAWVNKYLDLKDDVRRMCDVAIDRLNLARRRQSPGNKAIEGSICLEAMLGDNDNRELTYKLGLRSALLLTTDLAERREIKTAISDFYNLRSRTIHGRPSRGTHVSKDAACAAKGLEICTRVLRKIVQRNEKPIPSDWELSGGAASP